jgi:hypothetical protein
MPQKYLSTDPNAGQSLPAGASTPPTPYEPLGVLTSMRRGGGQPMSDAAEPGLIDRLLQMGESMRHPTSAADIGQLIFSGTDATRLGAGMAAGAQAARGPVSTALIKTGGAIERGGAALQPHAAQSALMDAILRGRPLEAIGVGVAPSAIQALGRLTQGAGRFIAPAAQVAEEAAPAASGPLSAMEALQAVADANTGTRLGAMQAVQSSKLVQGGMTPAQAIARVKGVQATAAPMAASPAAAEALQQSSAFRNLPSDAQVWSDAPAVAGRTAAPLAQATQKVTALASQMKIALDPTELEAVSRLVVEGYDPAAILEQVARQKMPASFQGLPTDVELNANGGALKKFPKGMRGKSVPPTP